MKALFKMDFDCGRMGNLEGVFIADTEDVEYLVNNKISVYFGESSQLDFMPNLRGFPAFLAY